MTLIDIFVESKSIMQFVTANDNSFNVPNIAQSVCLCIRYLNRIKNGNDLNENQCFFFYVKYDYTPDFSYQISLIVE